jgi:hypothetical protein
LFDPGREQVYDPGDMGTESLNAHRPIVPRR